MTYENSADGGCVSVGSFMRLHPSALGVRSRLLALVLVPALFLAVVGISATERQYRSVQVITDVRVDVRVLSDLTALRQALFAARAPVEVKVRAGSVGLDPETAFDLLGIEGGTSDLDAVAARLRALPDGTQPFTIDSLDAVRARSELHPDVALLDQFGQLDTLASNQWDRRFEQLRTEVVATGSTELQGRLDDLEAATLAVSGASAMVTDLADYWFGALTDSARVGPARAAIAVASDQFDDAVADLGESTDPEVAATARRVTKARLGTPFAAAIDDTIAGRPPDAVEGKIDEKVIADTFTSSFELFDPLLVLMEGRSAGLAETATALADEAARAAVLNLAGLAAALISLLVISLAVAGSLDRPLGRLIAAVRRVGNGELDVKPLPVEGPLEIAAASAAFNDVVANLNRIEGKVEALADGELEDPRLQEPLPGALGEAMEHWIQLLSKSIAQRNELQAQLTHRATHDALTSLANRAGALEVLGHALARASRTEAPLAVLYLDLDGFKAVNDNFGHQAGDEVLCEVARRLQDEARTGDVCARLGGDEFVVVAESVADVAGAAALARRVTLRIAEPFIVGGAAPVLTHLAVSIGIAMHTGIDDSPLSILARADEAAYRAKRTRSQVEIAGGVLPPIGLPERAPAPLPTT
ncbi:MAG: hypothetical protein JWO77_2175 [Ilumatobacteraceae bacterium]|nr:hypothetical protein [Ilumatobacteraceae bacterium]